MRNKMNREKLSTFISAGVVLLVLIATGFYIRNIKDLNAIDMVYGLLLVLIVAMVTVMMFKRTKEIKKGLPVEDEMAKQISHKAGFIAYIATIWISVAFLWYNGPFAENLGWPIFTAGHLVGIIVLGSGVIFLASYFYYNSKGI